MATRGEFYVDKYTGASYWSASGPIEPHIEVSNDILKSKLDDREYRYLKLPNGIRCVLVRDADVEKSAACMFVATGSLCDPIGIPEKDGTHRKIDGLAHFTEHMLFLGTKKYPNESHYKQFLAQHGGSCNAATGEDYTYYYFTVKNDKFQDVLDIYSQFFKEPLFTESATQREINAVDNEYKKNISLESRAHTQIEKTHIAVPGCVLNRFSTGNAETLNIPGILDDLKAHYYKNYSSNLMNLVLVGRHSLDELQQMAVQNFYGVVNRNLPPKDFTKEVVYNKEHSN